MSDIQSVAYFGGTFDPPHLGHEIVAREAGVQLGLDAVSWLITPDPPHKNDREITPIESRLALLDLITARYEHFLVSRLELERPPPYYAADTVEILKREEPEMKLTYIIGEDSLLDLPDWHQPARFISAIDRLAVATRPGIETDLEALEGKIPGLKEKTVFLSGVMVEISSSLIRQRIRAGAPYDHFLRSEVAAYIREHALYQKGEG